VAVATSAPAANVEHTLRELGLADLLPLVARGDQVARGKPFPDVFLAAAGRVDVAPAECLAFEDAPIGVEAAVAAGMTCAALTTSFDERTFLAGRVPPHACLSSYTAYLEGAGRWLREPA
jgi:beta-phosphoglucomutase